MRTNTAPSVALLLLLAACAPPADEAARSPTFDRAEAADAASAWPHSFARPDVVAIDHLELDLEVDFAARSLTGRASLHLVHGDAVDDGTVLRLDTRDLDIRGVYVDDGAETTFALGDEVPFLGRELTVEIAPDTQVVHVDYATRPEAAALQWLTPEQTAGGGQPFLFSQSQAILARTWVPCQDTPAVRFTYDATLRVPPALMALMSAENPTELAADGVYRFHMPQAIPSYLLAVAVGALEFRALDDRNGVYAEPSVVASAAAEFIDTPEMMTAIEGLYGPYDWGRFDVLVLPPSFPFGGMENPRLTFATPTILAGDRSLVALIAHELAHSWSGNLVTNATWDDFWLNEGFTVYLERRAMEAIRGREYSEMLAQLGRQDLEEEIASLGPESRDTWLHLDLAGRDPDDGMTDVAYEKGYFFLRRIEEAVGRERFDPFLRSWFDGHRFGSYTSAEFLAYLGAELLGDDEELAAEVRVDDWVYGPGLPDDAPTVEPRAFAAVDAALAAWAGGTAAAELDVESWTTHHWLHFLRGLPEPLDGDRMAELDAAFGFTETGNSELLHAWLLHAIGNAYEPAYPALDRFLTGMGRRKFLRPLYSKLAETDAGTARAKEIYERARATYHPLSQAAVDEILAVTNGEA